MIYARGNDRQTMICEYNAKKFCSEDISLIENYDKAIADTTKTWDCHHRLELDGEAERSMSEMKRVGLYFNRPASELIFLTHKDHMSLHLKGKTHPYYPRSSPRLPGLKLSEAIEKCFASSIYNDLELAYYMYEEEMRQANEDKERQSVLHPQGN